MSIYEKSDIHVKWTLHEYVSPMRRPMISDWRSGFPTKTRMADMDVFIRDMAKKSAWSYPELGGLAGKHLKGFKELRWRSDGVPHRIGGYFSAPDEFVMLVGWTHNKKKYDPPSALKTLIDRRNKLWNEEASLREFPIATS